MGVSTLPLFPIERAATAWPAPAAAGEAPLPPAQAAAPWPAQAVRPPLLPPQTFARAALLLTAGALAVGTAPPPSFSVAPQAPSSTTSTPEDRRQRGAG